MKRAAIVFLAIVACALGVFSFLSNRNRVLPLPAPGAETPGRAKDEEAIRRQLAVAIKAFNDHDAKAWSEMLHPGSDFTNVVGWTFHGREEVDAYHQRLFAKQRDPRLPSLEKAVMEVDGQPRLRFVRPDVATVDQRWYITGEIGVDGKESPKRTGMMMLLMTKEKGTWAVASFHNMELRTVPGMDIPKDPPPEFRRSRD